MSIVQSKVLVAFSVFLAALTIYSTANIFEAGASEGVPLLVVGIANNIMGAITAVMIFFGKRSAFKWFYAMSIGSLAAVPLVALQVPEAPVWLLAVIFLLMVVFCGLLWSILRWKKEALNRPLFGARDHA